MPLRPGSLSVLLVLAATPALVGFTGNKGAEAEFYAGVGIGQVKTPTDTDSYGEIGGSFRFKFRNIPYDDRAGWLGFGFSWHTWPEGSEIGNQVLTIAWQGGLVADWGEFGGGFVLFGDTTGIAPIFVLPSLRLRVGEHDKIQFGFGMADEAPFWAGGHILHWEAIVAVPFEKVWAPRLKIGARLNPHGTLAFERIPLELFGGVEVRLGHHVRIAVEASVGDGGGAGLPPSFSALVKAGGAIGRGTKSTARPEPAD